MIPRRDAGLADEYSVLNVLFTSWIRERYGSHAALQHIVAGCYEMEQNAEEIRSGGEGSLRLCSPEYRIKV